MRIATAIAVVWVLGAGAAFAQGVVMQKNLSLVMAKTIAEATIAECAAKGFNTSAAVVDRAGQLLVALRNEAASIQTVEMARGATGSHGVDHALTVRDAAGQWTEEYRAVRRVLDLS